VVEELWVVSELATGASYVSGQDAFGLLGVALVECGDQEVVLIAGDAP
jgi:hypothetical protein